MNNRETVDQAVTRLHSAIFQQSQKVPLDVNTARKLLKLALEGKSTITTRRDALEVLINNYAAPGQKIQPSVEKEIAAYVMREDLGVADYELRALIAQFLFNCRRNLQIKASLETSKFWRPILCFGSKTIHEDVRKLIGGSAGITSLKVLEVHHSLKLYSNGPSSELPLWVDYNDYSLTTNVAEPISGDPIMIEIAYSSVQSWSVRMEDTVDRCFFIDLHISNGQICRLGFDDLLELNSAKTILAAHVKSLPVRKVSVVEEPSQNIAPAILRTSVSAAMAKNSIALKSESLTNDRVKSTDPVTTSSPMDESPPPLPPSTIKTSKLKGERQIETFSNSIPAYNMNEKATPLEQKSKEQRPSMITPPSTAAPLKMISTSSDSVRMRSIGRDNTGSLIESILEKQLCKLEEDCIGIIEKARVKAEKMVNKRGWKPKKIKERHFSSIYRIKSYRCNLPGSLKMKKIANPVFKAIPVLNLDSSAILSQIMSSKKYPFKRSVA